MTTPMSHEDYSLTENARRHQHDSHLDPIADAMDRGDDDAWTNLHPLLQDRASIYRDFRAAHREAVERGLITDPAAAPTTPRNHL